MHWWRKSSKEGIRKTKEGSVVQAKFRIVLEEKGGRPGTSGGHNTDTVSGNTDHHHSVKYRNTSPSHQVSCYRFFGGKSRAQPVPLQGDTTHVVDARNGKPKRADRERGFPPSPSGSFSRPGLTVDSPDDEYIDMKFKTASASSRCDEIATKTATHCPSRVKLNDKASRPSKRNPIAILRPSNSLMNNRRLSISPKRQPMGSNGLNMHIPPISNSLSAPNSSTTSPLVAPRRGFRNEPLINSGFGSGQPHANEFLPSSGHCSTPGSGHIFSLSPVRGDVPELIYSQHSRCSHECSPTLSPKMASSGNSSRVNSDAVTSSDPSLGGASPEFVIHWPNGRKLPSYSPIPVLPPYSISTNSQVPQSLFQADSLPSPGTRWKKGRCIGSGTFGQVYLGFNSENGEMCAMKEVTLFADDRKSQESVKQLGQEIAVLSQLHHPNIVQYYGSEKVGDNIYIYLEYVSGGSIHRILSNYGPLGEEAIKRFTRQILSGLEYLHATNTMHRDVKGANLLLQPGGCVKLADFGMAKHITRETGAMSFKGTPHWIAPEVIRKGNADVSVDIWSLGCTLIEMATGKPPWSQYEEVAALFKIGNSDELPQIPDILSEEGKDFIRSCLQRDPLKRPTAGQLLDHPFMKLSTPLERHIPNLVPVEANLATNTFELLDVCDVLRAIHRAEIHIFWTQKLSTKLGVRYQSGNARSPKKTPGPVSPIANLPPRLHLKLD